MLKIGIASYRGKWNVEDYNVGNVETVGKLKVEECWTVDMSKFEMLKSNMHFLFGVVWFLPDVSTFSTFQLSTLQLFIILNISTLENPNLSSILVPGVVDRWAVDRWWHKYCLHSFPMKVKTRKAVKRFQGLQSPEAPKGCVCVFAPGRLGMHGLMGEDMRLRPKAWWNESVCFKHPKEPTGLQKNLKSNWGWGGNQTEGACKSCV